MQFFLSCPRNWRNDVVSVERSDVEAVVEEMRRDAVSRRCHINHHEVESSALVLSHLSRSMATLKSTLRYII